MVDRIWRADLFKEVRYHPARDADLAAFVIHDTHNDDAIVAFGLTKAEAKEAADKLNADD